MTSAIADLYDDGPGRVVDQALEELQRSLRAGSPMLAERTWQWIRSLAPNEPPATYFTHPLAFPIVLLPWLFESTLRATPDQRFQTAVARSSIAGYYAIRMIDDLMDGDRPVPPEVMPAALVLHSEFLTVYQREFASDQRFWEALTAAWEASAEAAAKDALSLEVDRARFEAVAARKVGAAKIPLLAVAHRSARTELVPAWSAFVDLFGRWHQMLNDVLGWSDDLGRGRTTYFLSEAIRRGARTDAVAQWVISDGIGWARDELGEMMNRLEVEARQLGSPRLVFYLQARQHHADEWFDRLASSLTALARLAATLD